MQTLCLHGKEAWMCLEAKCPVRELVELRLIDLEEVQDAESEVDSSLLAVELELSELQAAMRQFLGRIRAKAAGGAGGMVVFIADVNALVYELELE
jgi:hypothetical protein